MWVPPAPNYVELTNATRDARSWRADLTDTDTGETFECTARVIVNAAGPFVDELNKQLEIESNIKSSSRRDSPHRARIVGNEKVLAFFDDTERLFLRDPDGTAVGHRHDRRARDTARRRMSKMTTVTSSSSRSTPDSTCRPR